MAHRSDALRGGQWLARGEDAVADAIDKKRPPAEAIDWSSQEGAMLLARRIEEHYGGRVRCTVVRVAGCKPPVWTVASGISVRAF